MEINPKEFFVIEHRENDYGQTQFRFVSLYNSCRGPWCGDSYEAEAWGREHTRIIKMLHGGEK
jgi:hypothetical protein